MIGVEDRQEGIELRPEFQPHPHGGGQAVDAVVHGQPAVIAIPPDEFRPAEFDIQNLDQLRCLGKDAGLVVKHEASRDTGKTARVGCEV
jgi:hypothetical protein